MNAQTVIELTKQQKPNRHLALASKTYQKNSKDAERHPHGIEFVSTTIERAKENQMTVTETFFPVTLFFGVILGIYLNWDIGLRITDDKGGALVLTLFYILAEFFFGLMTLVWLYNNIEKKYTPVDKFEPLVCLTRVECILRMPLETWDEHFDPCFELQKYLKGLADKTKIAELEDDLAPWNPKKAFALKSKFNSDLATISKVIPVSRNMEIYFGKKQAEQKQLAPNEVE